MPKTNTKIYTEEFVLKELSFLLKTLKADKNIIYLWELFEDKNYTRFRYSEWIKEYKKNKEIQRISHTLKEILESRAITGAMKNKLNPTSTIFHLKNNYDWKDKSEVDQTIKWNLSINNFKELSTEELLKLKKDDDWQKSDW